MALSKSDILSAAKPLPPEPLEVEALGGTVYVARLSAKGADEYARDLKTAADEHVRGTILAHALVSEAGVRLFAVADAPALAELPKPVADAVCDTFSDVNELNPKKA